jgi:hypothetical protein
MARFALIAIDRPIVAVAEFGGCIPYIEPQNSLRRNLAESPCHGAFSRRALSIQLYCLALRACPEVSSGQATLISPD